MELELELVSTGSDILDPELELVLSGYQNCGTGPGTGGNQFQNRVPGSLFPNI